MHTVTKYLVMNNLEPGRNVVAAELQKTQQGIECPATLWLLCKVSILQKVKCTGLILVQSNPGPELKLALRVFIPTVIQVRGNDILLKVGFLMASSNQPLQSTLVYKSHKSALKYIAMTIFKNVLL